MNLLNILLQTTPPVDSTAVNKLNEVTGSVGATVDSIVANPESLSVKNIASTVGGIDWGGLLTTMSSQIIAFGFRLVAAIAVFYVGRFIVNKVHKMLKLVMEKKSVEPSLTTFLLSMLRFSLLFLLIITCVAILGIETSSFIAIFASAGVAVGLALSGTLQNFAGGVLILLLKPFKVGDFIVTGTNSGTVKEIQIFHTVIVTPNNERITIPNGGLSTDTVTNYSAEGLRRVEWKVGISYGDSVDTAREVILGLLAADKLTVKDADKAPTVAVASLDDSAVTLVVRAWCKSADYWDVFFAFNEAVYNELPRHGINFPFPQVDVHMDKV